MMIVEIENRRYVQSDKFYDFEQWPQVASDLFIAIENESRLQLASENVLLKFENEGYAVLRHVVGSTVLESVDFNHGSMELDNIHKEALSSQNLQEWAEKGFYGLLIELVSSPIEYQLIHKFY
jgi:hypothetical protein